MSDPTTGRPASVPDAPERAPGAPEAADGARNSEPSTSLSTGASLPTLPTRPKIGDTRPAPPGPPALQPPSPNGRKGQAPDAGPATERRPSSDGDSDTSVPATGPAGGGDLRRRRGGRGRSRGSGAASSRNGGPNAPAAAGDGPGNAPGGGNSGTSGTSGQTRAPRSKADAAPGAQQRRPAGGSAAGPAGGSVAGDLPERAVARSAAAHAASSDTGGPESLDDLARRGRDRQRPAGRALPHVRARRARGHPDRRARGQGAHRALRRPAAGRREPDRRQHLPRPGEERAAGYGGRLRRHRHAEERGPVLGRRLVRPRRRRAAGRRRPYRAPAPAGPDDRLPGDEEPDRAEGRAPHPGGVAPGPFRRARAGVDDLRDLASASTTTSAAAAADPRRGPPRGPRAHRAHCRGRRQRRGPAPGRGAAGRRWREIDERTRKLPAPGAVVLRAAHGRAGDP